MLTNKIGVRVWLCVAAAACLLPGSGCRPSGPEVLVAGARLLDRGQPERAARMFREATVLMPTNALAWTYLGLAYQRGGALPEAMEAYASALRLDPNLAEARFNLGCLRRDQGEWSHAREQFAAVTVIRKSDALAWQWLGESQLRLGENAAALKSLAEAVKLAPDRPGPWNWLGVAQTRGGRPDEALRCFENALRLQANHGPALLNVAILYQTRLNQPERALDAYRKYLAYMPDATNAGEVRGIVARLESRDRPEAPAKVVDPPSPTVRTASSNGPSTGILSRPVVRNTAVSNASRPTRPAGAAPASTSVVSTPDPEPRVETVAVRSPPLVVPSTVAPSTAGQRSDLPTSRGSPPPGASAQASPPAPATGVDAPARKGGFFSKINPLNLFKKKSTTQSSTAIPEPVAADAPGQASSAAGRPTRLLTPISAVDSGEFPKYAYLYRSAPAGGDARAGRQAFEEAEQLRRRGRTSEASAAYRRAVEADPSLFGAQFNLGVLSLEAGDVATALRAFEAAVRIDPESLPARYNLALALKAAGYPWDAARELDAVLKRDPSDTRSLLSLANLYARELDNKQMAREAYRRLLELEPGHPQASAIHFWLVQNPN